MRLYTYWRSTAAYRVRIALHYKGLAFESLPVNLLQGEQADESYRAVNPQGLVPTLEAGQNVVTQSTAILEYLEETFPTPALLPDDPFDRAAVRSFCQAIACDIHPLNNLRVLKHLRTELNCGDSLVSNWYQHWVSEGFYALEQQIRDTAGSCSFGDRITMADVFLVPQMFNARRFECDLTPFPTLCAVSAALETQPAFALAAPERQADAV